MDEFLHRMKVQDVKAPELPAAWGPLWNRIVLAARLAHSGPPDPANVVDAIRQAVVGAQLGNRDDRVATLRSLRHALSDKLDMVTRYVEALEIAEDYDLPTVEEIERTEWGVHRVEPAVWEARAAKVRPFGMHRDPGEDIATEMQSHSKRVPCMVQKTFHRSGRTYVIGLGMDLDVRAVFLFSNREAF